MCPMCLLSKLLGTREECNILKCYTKMKKHCTMEINVLSHQQNRESCLQAFKNPHMDGSYKAAKLETLEHDEHTSQNKRVP